MVELIFNFKSFSNLLLFLFISALSGFWFLRSFKKKNEIDLRPFIIINLLLFFIWWRLVGIDADESEHLHCAWMISQGMVPFRDFWQHHSPLIWLSLAPVIALLKPSVWVFELSRLFCLGIFSINLFIGWQLAKKTWGEKAKPSWYLFIILNFAIWGEYLWLRPDLFMMFFYLGGIYFTLKMDGRKVYPCLLGGLSFGLAFSFTCKQYLMPLLPVLVLLLERPIFYRRKLLVYISSVIISFSPLLFYLNKNRIFDEFTYWVFEFNKGLLVISVVLPLVVILFSVWSALVLFRRYRAHHDYKALVLLVAFCLCSVNSLTGIVFPAGGYYLGMWYFICAVLISGSGASLIFEKVTSLRLRSLAWGVCCSILLVPNITETRFHRYRDFSVDKKGIGQLLDYCKDDTCMLILPWHPVFCHDATRLYSSWEYVLAGGFPVVRSDIRRKNIAKYIMALKPAAISYMFYRKYLLIDMLQLKILRDEEFQSLKDFLNKNYTIQKVEKPLYYIRNDKATLHEEGVKK
ncbi:MAG: hypothetical protein JW788_04540 [Candidatus Omnitrophica bacterium]|nr:hypothetical protein [Candidatus Omnitrophota bacterium]